MIYINGQAVAPTISVQNGGIDDKITPDYITDGLIALYDGIKNTRNGHNPNSLVWEDLSGNNYDLTVSNSPAMLFKEDCLINTASETVVGTTASISSVVTMEIVLRAYRVATSCIMQLNRNSARTLAYISGGNYVSFKDNNTSYSINSTKRNHISADYSNSIYLINGQTPTSSSNTDNWDLPSSNNIQLFKYDNKSTYPFIGEICSVKLYNRVLTAEEKTHNLAIDIGRFGIEVE